MNSIDDIWDAPVLPSSPRPPIDIDSNESDTQVGAPRPSKRSRSSLFLSDSDDAESANVQQAQPPKPSTITDIDIDAMFADLDNEGDDAFTFKPLAPALDVEALRRQAEARHKNAALTLTPHPILPSSSPPRDTGDDADKGKDGEKGKGNDSKGDRPKVRRKVMRLDEGRLLGPTGIPQLIKDTKYFKTKGKGHEVTDLNRLLSVYQFWTHKMYPKMQFKDTVDRVEKLCHSKRMNVALSVWRDEAHGLVNGKQSGDHDTEGEGVIDLTDKEDQPGRATSTDNDSIISQPIGTAAPQSDAVSGASSSSMPSHPPSSGGGSHSGTNAGDDDFDIDAVIREEEERKRAVTETGPRTGTGTGTGMGMYKKKAGDLGLKTMVDTDEDEDEAMWNELDATAGLPTRANATTTTMATSSSVVDEDEDMWDVIRELDNEAAAAPARSSSTSASTEQLVTTTPDSMISEAEEDWEDMYL